MKIRIYKKENWYFSIKVIITILILVGLLGVSKHSFTDVLSHSFIAAISFYGILIAAYIFFNKLFLIGYLKGNGVEINEYQFPEIYRVYIEMVHALEIKKAPPFYLLQQGGVLNAFAIRFSCKNYIAIYSDIFDMIETDLEVVKFILGHELGHVKRRHISKRFWTMPASIVPFLGAAYSRSCEYTCDNIGHDLSHYGSLNGLMVLASGKNMYKRTDVHQYIENYKQQRSFSVIFTELCSSHPFLPNRIKNIQNS